jgi:hypothetical protein
VHHDGRDRDRHDQRDRPARAHRAQAVFGGRRAEAKTKPTTESVSAFLARIEDPIRRADCASLVALMQEATGEPAAMWGSSIVGFGRYRYTYDSGHSGESMLVGFSPRKGDLSLYVMAGNEAVADLLPGLGKHKAGKGCLYVKRLADVDQSVLREIVTRSAATIRERWPS